MTQDIQVCGLPRSGTAFVATLLNLNPRCIAFHELIATEADWRGKLEEARDHYQFVADVGTYQFLPKMELHEATKVAIIRSAEASAKAASEAFGYLVSDKAMREAAESLEAWIVHSLTHVVAVPFEYLFEVRNLEFIWRHCFGDTEPFPRAKVRLLLQNNIQRMNPSAVFSPDSLSARVKELF